MQRREIVLPETKPETEWVRGRALQKVSPTYPHAALQTLLAAALRDWADAGDRGRVGTEWRFRIAPPGATVRPLVPDVAYLSYDAMPRDAEPDSYATPLGSPTLAVEILSPNDRTVDVADKIATYVAAGAELVAVVDPGRSEIDCYDARSLQTLGSGDVLTHPALPGFRLEIRALFERARR